MKRDRPVHAATPGCEQQGDVAAGDDRDEGQRNVVPARQARQDERPVHEEIGHVPVEIGRDDHRADSRSRLSCRSNARIFAVSNVSRRSPE